MRQVSQFEEDSTGLMQEVFSEEIRNASNEKLSPVRRGTAVAKGTRKKAITRVLIDFFETICDGTTVRRKGEVQYCCVCGIPTVWAGRKTGHTGSHAKWMEES
jgi:hypothetical protein